MQSERNEKDLLGSQKNESLLSLSPLSSPSARVFVIVTGVKLVSQMLMMKWVKCNEFYLAHKWLTWGLSEVNTTSPLRQLPLAIILCINNHYGWVNVRVSALSSISVCVCVFGAVLLLHMLSLHSYRTCRRLVPWLSLSMKNGLRVIGPHRQATAGDCQSNPICLSASANQSAVGCVVLNGIFTH